MQSSAGIRPQARLPAADLLRQRANVTPCSAQRSRQPCVRTHRHVTATAATCGGMAATAIWTVDDMLASLRKAQQYMPQQHTPQQPISGKEQYRADAAVDLAKQTLMALGYNVPMKSGVRDSFCAEGGLEAVLQLLPHPELQYLAMSTLVVLLCSHSGSDASLRAATAEELGMVPALLPLLAPDVSWVIQGRCAGVLTLLVRQELHCQADLRRDSLRQGLQWQVLDGGGLAALTRVMNGRSQEAQQQAILALSMLTRFEGAFREALLTETALLPALVDFCTGVPHSIPFDIAAGLVNLCEVDSPALQQQVIEAGAIQALMQMQSLSYSGPFREAARRRLRHLAEAHPAAKRQIYNAHVVQPPKTPPAEWTAWWKQLKAELRLEASKAAAVRSYWETASSHSSCQL